MRKTKLQTIKAAVAWWERNNRELARVQKRDYVPQSCWPVVSMLKKPGRDRAFKKPSRTERTTEYLWKQGKSMLIPKTHGGEL